MLISIRRCKPLFASLACAWLTGCAISDRAPTMFDGGSSGLEDASLSDIARSDVPRGDVSLGDVSLGDAPRDISAVDGGDTRGVDGVPDGTLRDGPNVLPDAPTVCIPGAACLPANPCHQGEIECSGTGVASCRDTSRSQGNGTPCDKGVCLDGMCQACAAGTKCDVTNKPCRVGTIVCSTGAPVCTETDNKPNGSSCGAGLVCQEGACKPCVTGEACAPTNACHVGKLDCSGPTPTCNDTGMNIPAGGTCAQDKVCDATGSCVSCVAGATCVVASNPCRTGTTACNTGAPVCIESGNTANGSPCGTNKVCSGGTCINCTAGLQCVPANPCHNGTQVCSPSVECVDNGSAVMDGVSCGTDQVCSGGMCTPCAAGKTCTTTNACRKGTTSCATGVSKCNETGDQDDGTTCGMNQVCSKGVCGACTTDAPCTPTANPCHSGKLNCSSGTPVCNDSGSSLGDGVSCGPDLVCRGGMCISCQAGGACQPTDSCKTGTYSCMTGSQVCVATGNKPPGAECGPDQVCSSSGMCVMCNDGDACTPMNSCHKGTLSCTTGARVCVDTGVAQANGFNCGMNFYCLNGECKACTEGLTCAPANACKNGATSCMTGASTCVETTNKNVNTPCGPGQSCSNGRTTAATVCNASGQCATPPVTNCASGFCNSAGTNCLDCGGQTACNGICCSAGQACCQNTCSSLDTPTNCGVCGNACATGKKCSGSQCLWDDGHVCGTGPDCASGVCGGRCCPAGTSCKCTQPSAGNIVKNPGFDTNLSNWNIDSGPGTFAWTPRGTVDSSGYSGDVDQCAYSGSVLISCNLGDGSGNCVSGSDPSIACQPMWQCLPLSGGSEYNFGMKMSNEGSGSTQCMLELWTGTGCSGSSTLIVDWGWINLNWPGGFLNTPFASGSYQSARISCYRCGTGSGRVDQVYLSKNPGGY